ncbi:FAD-dependent oxidoreductase [Bacillus fungorum]|uniref:FAD-dependent oxidoreductase n=1 Tax=Bacillus fungorum TaxID=2039284 RepID=UPI00318413C6
MGLVKTKNPKQIIIAGAGISGLVAASLLKEAGHKITILEANNRIGWRIYTIREPFSAGKVHFAGEHTTLTHGWMQGAIESGIRVAYEVNEQ